jgi:uncharacterized protein
MVIYIDCVKELGIMDRKIFKQKLEDVKLFVKDALQNSFSCHDYEHTLRVFNNAKMLLKFEKKADSQVVLLASLLHDIGRSEEFAEAGRVCHAEVGAKIAEKYLLENGFDMCLVSKVCRAIRVHRFRNKAESPETLEEKILYDADKLDSLGAVGIGRAFMFAAKVGARLHNKKSEALRAKEYSSEDTAYREYLVKFVHIPKQMQTLQGRAIAEKELEFMREFFDKLNIQSKGKLL